MTKEKSSKKNTQNDAPHTGAVIKGKVIAIDPEKKAK